MTFGPTLADGWASLFLVSDNGGGIRQDLYALAVVPEPSTWVMGAVGIACAAWGAARRHPATGHAQITDLHGQQPKTGRRQRSAAGS